jgi:hypothetical protein
VGLPKEPLERESLRWKSPFNWIQGEKKAAISSHNFW